LDIDFKVVAVQIDYKIKILYEEKQSNKNRILRIGFLPIFPNYSTPYKAKKQTQDSNLSLLF